MDKYAFKLRMQALKAYREQNPGKGYLDWKASLPDNLQDESSYNLLRAYELRYEPEYVEEDRSYHLPTRDQETGEILKKPWHPTFLIGLQEDAKLGYYPLTINGTTYTTTWEGNENPIYKYADGGEVPPEPIPYKGKLYTDRYGKKYTELLVAEYYDNNTDEIDRFSGTPMVKGVKPLLDARDAADFTPVGDAVAAYEAYDSAKLGDWVGAALSAATMIPFVPLSIKSFRRNYKGITPKNIGNRVVKREVPRVNKDAIDKAMDSYMNLLRRNKMSDADYLSDIANEANRVFEDLNTVPYRARAIAADKLFGTNYNGTYDVLDDLYEKDYFSLPEVSVAPDNNYTARMQAKKSAADKFFATGEGAGPRDFELKVNLDKRTDPTELATHELNHYTDFSISRNSNTTVNNPMLRALLKSLKSVDSALLDNTRKYIRSGTELKAYMNTLRRRMLNDNTISNIDDQVSSKLLKNYLDQLPDSDYIKKAYSEHKNINSYTKWFNSIPLLGVGALGVYDYDNKND